MQQRRVRNFFACPAIIQKSSRDTGCFSTLNLLFDDLQDIHGASLNTDTTSDTLGSRILGLEDHNLSGANLNALATGNTVLLADHVHAGLGILSNRLMLTDLSALAALNTNHGLSASALCDDLDAGQIGMELFIECLGASLDTFQTGHTFSTLFDNKLLHMNETPLIHYVMTLLYIQNPKMAMVNFHFL